MRRILTVLIIAALITGCSWGKRLSPGWAGEQKPFTPEQRVEQLTLDVENRLRKLQKRYDVLIVQVQKLADREFIRQGVKDLETLKKLGRLDG
ncbi:hypothetical protein LCGC14_2645710 [marine sediment metagenome]|uniref:Uncharacterized protein n=1 Tax=marine sediment metagenome TaxID=412755 RepID=A0A0F9AIK1_9ZZZZ